MLKGVLIFNFKKYIPHLFPLFLLLTFSMYLFGGKILRVTSEDTRRRRYILKLFITPKRREWVSFTLSWRTSLSCRNQSLDFLCKSFDWFLYNRDLRNEWLHPLQINVPFLSPVKASENQSENQCFKGKKKRTLAVNG